MAVVSLSTIKNWFRTALKPTQSQFWDTWDSFWHKQDSIPTSSITGLDTIIAGLPTEGELAIIDTLVPASVNVSGSATFSLLAGTLLETIILEGSGVWKVGTSAGADDIVFDDASGLSYVDRNNVAVKGALTRAETPFMFLFYLFFIPLFVVLNVWLIYKTFVPKRKGGRR